jgi:hypothetical protein
MNGGPLSTKAGFLNPPVGEKACAALTEYGALLSEIDGSELQANPRAILFKKPITT